MTCSIRKIWVGALLVAPICACVQAAAGAATHRDPGADTTTPIKHLLVIIGENRSFDHIFATYEPKSGERVWNLLSQGIVRKDGAPGPNFRIAEQRAAPD
jgi:phospholipase C